MLQNLFGANLSSQVQSYLSTPQGQAIAQQFLQNNPQLVQQLMPQMQQFQQPQQQAQYTTQPVAPVVDSNVDAKLNEYGTKLAESAKVIEELKSDMAAMKDRLKTLEGAIS